jgi:hypothetical protein
VVQGKQGPANIQRFTRATGCSQLARKSAVDAGFDSPLRYTLPLQMAPAMNSASANKAERITTSRLAKVFRDTLVLPPFLASIHPSCD